MFNEYNEYHNPEATDYDLNITSNEVESNNNSNNKLIYELYDLIGILEDNEQPPYGLTYEEYMNPTRETINKVKKAMEEEQNTYHR